MSYIKDLIMQEYDRLYNLNPDLPADVLADLAYAAAQDRLADIADHLKEKAKYNEI